MTRVAAIDCGTNSIRLYVADVFADSSDPDMVDVVRRMTVVRLGEGVDRTGRFSDEAIERTLVALRDYTYELRVLGAERVRMVATSAARDATNSAQFLDAAEEVLGVRPEVISGDEEARLSFHGAVSGLRPDAGSGPPFLVVDIGGGSTEFVLGTDEVTAARSVDIGCVRLTERTLPSDPPTDAEIRAATRLVDELIATAAQTVPVRDAATLVAVAGSATTVAAIALALPAYDPVAIHGSVLSAAQVHGVADQLLAMPRAQRAALPVMHPGRVDVIGAGALILSRIVEQVGVSEVVISEHDILDGIAWYLG
ncbi:MAG: exopolyphosphatase / guanosine-5-triphosphate,3-diphosphate pyrophosphatase [Frankiales bacterium]|nr:exopolyphosphatase / guanosine-5-triphosphate,3-diphosphate pyrophosphatase [Frankiales bacterium]